VSEDGADGRNAGSNTAQTRMKTEASHGPLVLTVHCVEMLAGENREPRRGGGGGGGGGGWLITSGWCC
jgi:hypothetical protein